MSIWPGKQKQTYIYIPSGRTLKWQGNTVKDFITAWFSVAQEYKNKEIKSPYEPSGPSGRRLSQLLQHEVTLSISISPDGNIAGVYCSQALRRNPIEDGAISSFSGQKSVPE